MARPTQGARAERCGYAELRSAMDETIDMSLGAPFPAARTNEQPSPESKEVIDS
jgi:hypothetical protein